MRNKDLIDIKLNALAKSKFRAGFHLGEKERNILEEKGLPVIREHALDLITKRLAPAYPVKDGKQTPFRGHPVFIAQHAIATCCRNCLSKWHGIQKGRELTEDEKVYIIDVIESWLVRDLQRHFH